MRSTPPTRWAAVGALVATLGPWSADSLFGSAAARALSESSTSDASRGIATPGADAATAFGATGARTPDSADAPADAASEDATSEDAAVPADGAGAVTASPDTVQFNFKQATFDEVLDFFSRVRGKPLVKEAGVPEGKLDYLSPEAYTPDDALRILNVILKSRGVVLQETQEFLYLRTLDGIARSEIPTFVGQIPDDLPASEIVTVVRPLNIAVASTMAERLAEMVAAYGSVTAMPAQNALLITETAAQVRRLSSILDELDREDPEGAIEIIPLRHVRASDLMEPLKGLLSQKVVKFMVNQKGKQVQVEENELPGLTMAPDDRTNSIIAKGVQSRIDKLREVIDFLDVPAAEAGRAMRTFTLARLAPEQAKRSLDTLFSQVPKETKPTIITSDLDATITVVGSESNLAEAERVLTEVDGLAGTSMRDRPPTDTTMTVVPVEQADAGAVLEAMRGLLSRRQEQMVKLLPGPDGRSIVVSGPAADVASIEALVPALDLRAKLDRTVRILPLEGTTTGARAVVERANELAAQLAAGGDQGPSAVTVELDDDATTVTLIGPVRDVDRYAGLLREVERTITGAVDTRSLQLVHAVPSRIAPVLESMGRRVLAADGASGAAGADRLRVVALDPIGRLQVQARPQDFPAIDGLLRTLDRPGPADVQLRMVSVSGVASVDALIERTTDLYGRLADSRGLDAGDLPSVEHDAASETLILSGDAAAVELWSSSLAQARALVPPSREGRLIELRQREASDVVEPLRELFAMSAGDGVPAPDLSVVDRLNALFVRAEPAQFAVIESLLRELDTLDATDLPPMRMLQVRSADVGGIANLLRRRYDARPADQRRTEPVSIDADGATGTLIVTAHPAVWDEIKDFVDDINASSATGADRETMIFPLRRARATDLSQALGKLYPEPPVPRDSRGRPLPHLQQPREVYVSADAATNTLIIEAPAERRTSFEALVDQLDRVELPPRAELRTYRIERGDPALVARTLTELARRGVMSAVPEDGGKPVDVLVQAEPRSRTLIVAGDAVTFEQTEAMLADLEMVPVQRSLRVFTIPGADLEAVSAQAQRLYDEQSSEIPGAGDVSVEVDRDAGALLVVADDESMVRFAGILSQLETTIGPPPDVRLIPLEYATSTDVAAFLTELAGDHRALTGEGGTPPSFEAIERTNSILVAASPDQHGIIRELVRGMDRMDDAETPPLRILRLRTAEAGNLATALQRQYDARPPEQRTTQPVRVTADAQTNALIVAAHPDVLPEIEAIVADLNEADRFDAEGREIRIFPLKVARAEQLAQTLDEMFPEPPVPVDSRGRPLPQLKQPREVVVRADSQTNSIIVDAPAPRMAGFERLVEQLDRQEPSDESAIRTYEIVHADVAAVRSTMDRLAREGALAADGRDRRVPVTIDMDERTRRLVVSGPVEIFERVEQVLAELDVRPAGPATTLRFVTLEHARAERVADMLRQVLLVRVSEEVPDAGAAAERLLEVTADRSTNTLILSLPEPLVPVAEELIERLDVPAATIGDRTIRVRPLMFADASEVGRTLGPALGAMTSPATGDPLDARLLAAGGSNAVILVGLPVDLDLVEQLIDPLDARPARDAVDARTFRLEHAEASSLAPILRTMLDDQMGSDPRVYFERLRRSRGDVAPPTPIRVEADARTNSLIVSGPQRTVALAEQLLTRLDRSSNDAMDATEVFTPTRASASTLADAIRRQIAYAGISARAVEVAEEPGTGSLIVAGDTDVVARVREWLEDLDRRTPVAPAMELVVIDLGAADATVVARTVEPLLRDRARWPQSLRAAAEAGVPMAEPQVTPDPGAQRVLVSVPGTLADMARDLIGALDVGPSQGATDMRVFTLREAESDEVARALRESFEAEGMRRGGTAAPTIASEPSSNAVVVTGTAQQLERVEAIVAGLDAVGDPDGQRVRTVFLEHARAEAIAPIVEELLGEEQEEPDPFRPRIFWGGPRGFEEDDEPPTIRVAADSRLNAVVISATPGVLDVAEAMVEQLDVPRGRTETDGASRVRVLTLRAADAAEVAETLAAVLDDGGTGSEMGVAAPVVRVDTASNSLVIRATDAQYATIEETVGAIDDASLTSARQLRVLPIDRGQASAADVAAAIERLLQRGDRSMIEVVPLESLLDMAPDRTPASPPRGSQGDARDHGSASDEDPAVHASAIRASGDDAIAWPAVDPAWERGAALPASTVRIFARALAGVAAAPMQPVAAPDAAAPARGLEGVVPDASFRRAAGAAPATPATPAASSSDGAPDVDLAVAEVAAAPAADAPAAPAPANASVLAAAPATPAAESSVSEALPADAAAIDRFLARVEPMIALMTSALPAAPEPAADPAALATDTVVIPAVADADAALAATAAADASTSVDSVDSQDDAEQTAADAATLAAMASLDEAADVTIAVDPDSNALVVVGAPRSIERIEALARQLAEQLPPEPRPVRAVPLPSSVDAERVRQLVNQVLQQLAPPGGRPGDLRRRSTVLADAASNTVYVVASDSDFTTIGRLVGSFASSAMDDRSVVRLYPLETTTAERAGAALEALVGGETRGRRSRQADRMRTATVTVPGADGPVEAVLDPARTRIVPDAGANTLLVIAPPESLPALDAFVELLDQSRVNQDATLRVFPLRHARAEELRRTLRDTLRTRFDSLRRTPGGPTIRPEVVADERTNALLVTASPEQIAEVETILADLDRDLGETAHELEILEMRTASPSRVAELLREVVAGLDPEKQASVRIVADDESGRLLLRVPDEIRGEIGVVIDALDRSAAADLPVRTIQLERADAEALAQTVQRFFDDRAWISSRGRGRRQAARQVSVIGNASSKTLLVAASDEDFAQVEDIVARFDSAEANEAWAWRIVPLEHAQATDLAQTVVQLVNELEWSANSAFWMGGGRGRQTSRGALAVMADTRLNALIVSGQGDKFEIVEEMISMLDVPTGAEQTRVVRSYEVAGDPRLSRDLVEQVYGDGDRPWWQDPDPSAVQVRVDDRAGRLLVVATEQEHEEISGFLSGLADQGADAETRTVVLPVEYVSAGDVARTLSNFLRDRARSDGRRQASTLVLPSESAGALLVSGTNDAIASVRDLLDQLDQPDATGDRRVEILVLEQGDADQIATILREQFGANRSGRGSMQAVRITVDRRANSLVVSAPAEQYASIEALARRLDTRQAGDETIIRTFQLASADAIDAEIILAQALDLDASGETEGTLVRLDEDGEAALVKARVVGDTRSNSLIVTATPESFPVIEQLIAQLDEAPSLAPVDYRILTFDHAFADDVRYTLDRVGNWPGTTNPTFVWDGVENQLVVSATADQFELIEDIIEQLDVPKETDRRTEFVPLQFAEASKVRTALSMFYGPLALEAATAADRGVRLTADPATNSLVISADDAAWPGLLALIQELDSAEYDASLQLRVLALRHADARSVADAINQTYGAAAASERESGRRRAGNGQRGGNENGGENEDGRRGGQAPAQLVAADEWVRAAAEPLTNSVVVSASRQTLGKIESIVEQLDVPDVERLPAPRLIPVPNADPVAIAASLERLYAEEQQGRRGGVRILGDPVSGTVIVRADDVEFEQIESIAQALLASADESDLDVAVMRLEAAPAARVAQAIRSAYGAKAERRGGSLTVDVDAAGNALVIGAAPDLLADIRTTVAELDRLSPAAGQGIFIIELQHVAPEEVERVIQRIGLDRPAPRNSTGRLVVEPIRVTPLSGRNAVVVIANPADRETVVGLLGAIDAEPGAATADTRIVALERAQASALVRILESILDPSNQQTGTPLARAVQEQVRRLRVRRDRVQDPDVELDLTEPIRLVPDDASNSIVVSSTEANVAAVAELIRTFDAVPITDGLTVQILPLQNIEAQEFERIASDLFRQGKGLGRVPGGAIDAIPGGTVGQALADEVAISVDARTNTVVVAGREDAVALVEVLAQRLDEDVPGGWVEPRIVAIRHADATELAETLEAILVEGRADGPQAGPLRNQVGRLRMVRQGDRPGGGADGDGAGDDRSPFPPRLLESDVFQPMSRLVIRAEDVSNSLILVGTPDNLEVVGELVAMLDTPAASPSAAVRIYPVEVASAARVAETARGIFEAQASAGVIRDEDRVIIEADTRTNALIVSTTARSFAVFEHLLEALDTDEAPDLQDIRQVKLEVASASRVADLVTTMMDARLERLREVQPETANLERTTIVADPRTNSLVVAASNEAFAVIETLVSELDQQDVDRALVEVLDVEQASVERLAETIEDVMARRYAQLPADVRRGQEPLVITDPRTSSLLVAANPEDLGDIRDLVARLDAAPSDPAVGLHVIPVPTTVGAESLADRIERLMRERQESIGETRASDRVTVEAEPGSNSLIVAASREQLDVVQGLLDVLVDAGADAMGADGFDVIPLTASRATDIVELVDELYVDEARDTRGDNAISVTADERINAVLVKASAADIAAIRTLVERLDGERPAAVLEIKTFALASADAVETVSLIDDVLDGGPGAGRGSAQATVLRYLGPILAADDAGDADGGGGGIDGEFEVSGATRDQIRLTPDSRTNAVIVRAPADAMRLIEQLIADLDETSTGAQNIRIFQLVNADATVMAEILGDLFSLQQGRDQFVLRPTEGGPALPGSVPGAAPGVPGGLGNTSLTAVPGQRQNLSITVDSRTNSLLVSGTQTYLDLVSDVVQELDALEATERETFVYQLRNARADEVATVLGEFVREEQDKLVSTLDSNQIGSAARLLEREITIRGDVASNTVLVSVSPRYRAKVEELIQRIDIDPPQVLIQVLLAEVTLDTSDEWGVDFNTSVRVDDVVFGPAYGLASAFVGGMGTPSLSVVGKDFEMLLRAVQAQGRVQVLSNPSIMAVNNVPAELFVGERLQIAANSSVTEGGNINTTTRDEEVGLKLNVTPSINPDGYVRLEVLPEISSLTSRVTEINENLSTPVITERSASTTVTVKDGQTIVIGGLISDRYEYRERKVPFFGDIPWLGALFRSEDETALKTELLIVLTPHVVYSATDVDRVEELTDREIDRLSLPGDVRDQLRRGLFEGSGLYDKDGNPIDWSDVFVEPKTRGEDGPQ